MLKAAYDAGRYTLGVPTIFWRTIKLGDDVQVHN